jgi:hypothetical protein
LELNLCIRVGRRVVDGSRDVDLDELGEVEDLRGRGRGALVEDEVVASAIGRLQEMS